MMLGSRFRARLAAILLATCTLPSAIEAADEIRWADYFGFLPLEIYKLESRIGNLLAADLDGDGIDDVIVADNARSRIDVLHTKPSIAAADEPVEKNEPNFLPNDRRLRERNITVNREIVSLQAGDFNADGKVDLVYYGNPAELVVLLNKGDLEFTEGRKFQTGEAIETAGAVTVGDFDRDGLADIALVTNAEVLTIYQRPGGRLSDPVRLAHSSTNPRMIRAIDMDGDGGDDLVMLDGGEDHPVRIRFSTAAKTLGPEERFAVEPLRAYAFGNLDGKPGSEFLSIEAQSGRARVAALAEADDKATDTDADARRGRLLVYPLPRESSRNRSIDIGDIDGDGKLDVVAADPGNAQFFVYLQEAKLGLGAPRAFPNLNGGRSVRVADLDGDKRSEVYVISQPEKQIGRSVFSDGRLSFPAPLPITGEPISMTIADLDGKPGSEVIYVTRDDVPGSTADALSLRALTRGTDGALVPLKWGDSAVVPLPELNDTPIIQVLDVDRDGRPDIIFSSDYGPKAIRLGRGDEPPAPLAGGVGPLTDVPPSAIAELLLGGKRRLVIGQKTYARDLSVDRSGLWIVHDQFNTNRNNAQIQGLAALDTDGDGKAELALYDRTSKSVLYLEPDGAVYRPAGSLSIGAIDFQGLRTGDLDGDGRDDLVITGAERFGVVYTGRKGRRLEVVASYETNRKDARLGDLAQGDLNADGRPDIAFTDPGDHFLEIATNEGKPRLARALAFRIFERKSFRRVSDLLEPREIVVADVDGDKRDDIVLIVHDRVLIYRQDSGDPPKKVAGAKP
ncbi:MAG: VCBS repeat-containing protein [Isosphaeraceae bacterium]|nr:VCBS repeat-containing protein [Isosphaeraceae bacterium]